MAPTNVFVLCTGRCGSMTFAGACSHIDNYSAAHESLMGGIGPERLDYPPDHIEVDNRLSWFLGRLARRYPDQATFYVHLRRDREETARSFQRRWGKGIVRAYARGIVSGGAHRTDDRLALCRDYCHTVDSNIEQFLAGRSNAMTVRLEEVEADFPRFWERIGARGDLAGAMAEWSIRHNRS